MKLYKKISSNAYIEVGGDEYDGFLPSIHIICKDGYYKEKKSKIGILYILFPDSVFI